MQTSNTLVFDIETIPDMHALHQLGHIPEATESATQAYLATRESTFLPHHLQKVIAISCVLERHSIDKTSIHVNSLCALDANESDIIQKFFDLIDEYTPQLVSWNGMGFDLPVLQQRALILGVEAKTYWDLGDRNHDASKSFKWNNYISRYHFRHLDLMDVLALYQGRANAGLDVMAKLTGLPGKLGMSGDQVWPAYVRGELVEIRAYCETDVMNTYLLFKRFNAMRYGMMNTYPKTIEDVQLYLKQLVSQDADKYLHWQRYLEAWGCELN